MKIGLIGPSYTLDSISAEAQKVMNWYPEIIESGAGRGPMRLCPTPGIKKFAFEARLSEGPNTAKMAVDDPTSGTKAWTDPTEAEVSDDVWAWAQVWTTWPAGPAEISHYLKLTGFAFGLPLDAVVFGIRATVEGRWIGGLGSGILRLYLVKGGVVQTATLKTDNFGSYPLGAVDGVVSYGGPTDPWNTNWPAADFIAPGFGIAIQCEAVGGPGTSANFYVDAATLEIWYGTPLGGTSSRGLHTINDRVFAVVGPNFYELDSAGLVTLRGVVADDGETVSIAGGPTQLLIVSAGVAYSYDLTTDVLAPIVGMLGIPIIAGYSDGYFIVVLQDSQRFQISALLDATTWDPLDIAQVSVFPDNLVSMLVDHRELWLWGKKASQVYHDSGNPDFPWEPIDGAYIEAGCAAQRSPVRLDNSVFWVGEDERGAAVAWRASGYTPTRVSNHAVEQAWQSYSTITDAVSYAYQADGHSFWVLSFATAKATWVYDASTGMWHERGTWDPNLPGYVAHRSQCHAYAWGKHLVGDRLAPNIYEMEKWAIPGPTCELQVIIRWSDDFGHTWGNQHVLSAGRIGEYNTRIHLDQLGRARGRVFEISVIDLVITDDGMPIRRLRRTPIICNEWNWIYFRKLLLDMEVGSGKCDLIEGYVEADGGKIG